MQGHDRPREISLDEWAAQDEDEGGELVDGQIVEEEEATNLHELIVSWVICTLANWARPRGGWVFGSEHKLAVAPSRGRKPDVTVYAPGVKLSAKASVSRTPPLVVVEIVSARARDVRRDRVDKLAEYAAFGVRYYWLVDPETRLFELLELGADGRYVIARAALDGSIEPPGCEGLTLDLALAAEVAELDADEAEGEDLSKQRLFESQLSMDHNVLRCGESQLSRELNGLRGLGAPALGPRYVH